jgi:hypothetical protein
MGSIRDNGNCTKCGAFLSKEEAGYGLCLKCSNIGTASELKVQSLFTQAGYAVATVLNPMSPTDLVVSKHGEWLPVQVKTAYSGIVNLCKTTPTGRVPYAEREAKLFVVVDGDDLYVVPRWVSEYALRPSLTTLVQYKVEGGITPVWEDGPFYTTVSPPWQYQLPFPEVVDG